MKKLETEKKLDFLSDWKKLLELSKDRSFIISLIEKLKTTPSEILEKDQNAKFAIFWNRFNNDLVIRFNFLGQKDLESFNADFDFISWFPVFAGRFINEKNFKNIKILSSEITEEIITKTQKEVFSFLSVLQSVILDYKTTGDLYNLSIFTDMNKLTLPIDLLSREDLFSEFLRFTEIFKKNSLGYFVGRSIQPLNSKISDRLILDKKGELLFPYSLIEDEIVSLTIGFLSKNNDHESLKGKHKLSALDFVCKRKEHYPELIPEWIANSSQNDLEMKVIFQALELSLFESKIDLSSYLNELLEFYLKGKTESDIELVVEKILNFLKARRKRPAQYKKILPEWIYQKTYENNFLLVEDFDVSELDSPLLKDRELILYSPFSQGFTYRLNLMDQKEKVKLRFFLVKNNVKLHSKAKKKIEQLLYTKTANKKLTKSSRFFLEKILELEVQI
jgi:hypothetical protein